MPCAQTRLWSAAESCRAVVWAGAAVALSSGLVGCVQRGPVPQYARGPVATSFSHVASHAGVASDAAIFGGVLNEPQGQQLAWRDESLNPRPIETAYEQAAWPGPSRPTLDRPGRIYLGTRSEQVLYFRQEGYQYRSQSGVFWAP